MQVWLQLGQIQLAREWHRIIDQVQIVIGKVADNLAVRAGQARTTNRPFRRYCPVKDAGAACHGMHRQWHVVGKNILALPQAHADG